MSVTSKVPQASRETVSVPSQRDAVMDALLTAITGGRLKPGDKIPMAYVSAQLGVAVGTIREAVALLARMRIVDGRNHRRNLVATPTAPWLVALAAESMGLSMFSVELGIANATDAERHRFADAAAHARNVWAQSPVDLAVGAEEIWGLVTLLAGFSRNEDLATLLAEKRDALRFGVQHLTVRRNPAMITRALDDLAAAVRTSDRAEGADIIRDLYAFVINPLLDPSTEGTTTGQPDTTPHTGRR